jgi:hypothetical protein
MRLRIIGTDLPGRDCGRHHDGHVGLQVRAEPTGVVSLDVTEALYPRPGPMTSSPSAWR